MNYPYYFTQEGRERLVIVKAAAPYQAILKLARLWSGEPFMELEGAKNFLRELGVEGPLETEEIQ